MPRGDLRLRMVDKPGVHRLDGGWWPYTRDLVLEMGDLARNFPARHGRIISAVYSNPDWDTTPRVVNTGTKVVRMEPASDDDPHVLTVLTSVDGRLSILVIPPRFTTGQGDEALLAATTPGNAHSGAEVLLEVTNQYDADPGDRWDDWARADDRIPAPTPAAAGRSEETVTDLLLDAGPATPSPASHA